MREDTEFHAQAKLDGLKVSRWVCVAGHSVYPGPEPERRGWVPAGPTRRCIRCAAVLPPVLNPTGYMRTVCEDCQVVPKCRWCRKPLLSKQRKTGEVTCGPECQDAWQRAARAVSQPR